MIDPQEMDQAVDRVAELLRTKIGLRPDSNLRGRLRRAIRDDAAEHGQSLAAYVDALVATGHALQGLLNRVTIQETAFFRHPKQFQVLAQDVLPGLARPVTIWSAGCANGQEAYSLAMVLAEQGVDGRVIATDLSTSALRRTEQARYSDRELTGLSPDRIAEHLIRTDDGLRICDQIRSRVSTLRHNLLEPLPPEIWSCDVVFCRNVLIYLSPEHVRTLLDQIADKLPPTISLFVGGAETIWQVSDRFKAVPTGDTFLYRRQATSAVTPNRSARRAAPTSAPVRHSPKPGTRAPAAVAGRMTARRPSAPATDRGRSEAAPDLAEAAGLMATAGQDFVAAGDYDAAVVAFRKCAYLTPHDPMPHLNLGLALEAAGDETSAERAYAAARRALLDGDPRYSEAGIEGYAAAELVRLLDSKQRALST